MTTVYVLSFGSYSDEESVGVFATLDDAMDAAGGPARFSVWEERGQWIRDSKFDEDGDFDGISGIDARIIPFEIGQVRGDLSNWLTPGPTKRKRLGL